MPNFSVSDNRISITPNDFIKAQDIHAKQVSIAIMKWHFSLQEDSAEQIYDEYLKLINRK